MAPRFSLVAVSALFVILAAQTAHAAYSTIVPRQPVEMSPSVTLYFINDVLPVQDNTTQFKVESAGRTTRCLQMLERASKFNAKQLHLVITHYWFTHPEDPSKNYFCFIQDQDMPCKAVTPAMLQEYYANLQTCMAAMVKMGFEIFYTPMVDDAGPASIWRNAFALDPLKKYQGFSYNDVSLDPVATIMGTLMQPGTRYRMCVEGEMNLSVVKFASQYLKLIAILKKLVLKGRSPQEYKVTMGTCVNWDKLNGVEDIISMAQAQASFDVPELLQLLRESDFLGVSNYPSLSNPLDDATTMVEMDSALKGLDRQLKVLGTSIAELSRNRELLLAEFGFGGSLDQNTPAKEAKDIASKSWFGIRGPYTRARDPWQTFQPEAVQVPTRTALRRVYNTTSRYLMRGGSLEYRVDGLHLWNVASWDALGIHWRSISAEGSYYEQGVAAIVAAHNKNLIRRAVMPRWAGGQ